MMQTLERFWSWYGDEKPTVERARKMLEANVSGGGRVAVAIAASHIDCHANGGCLGHRFYDSEAFAHYPEALRDLSLALCSALARLVEQVPAHVPAPSWLPLNPASEDTAAAMAYALQATEQRQAFRKEYLGKWAEQYETFDLPTGTPEQRSHCIRDAAEADDGRYCRECLGRPCRFSARYNQRKPEPYEFRNVIVLNRGAVTCIADADRFRGTTNMDWRIAGERDQWYAWGGIPGLTLLRYLVREVLVPGGGKVSADCRSLERLGWWPRAGRVDTLTRRR